MLDEAFRRVLREEVRSAVREELSGAKGREPSPGPTDDHVSYEQAALEEGCSASTIGLYVRTGRLTRYGSPRNALVSLSELRSVRRATGRRHSGGAEARAEQIANRKR